MKQKRGGKGISRQAIGLIEYVLTSEPQTINEILEAMFEKGHEYIDTKNKYKNRLPTTLGIHIPTRKELIRWLSSQPNIESARFDKWTNEVVSKKAERVAKIQTKYWRP
tara:strand:- start:3830 stop:4156 length:327 start_codon:yes stop_codon:yes gene_type:complete